MRAPIRTANRLLDGVANAVLGWSARHVGPGGRAWIEAMRGELDVVEGGGLARLLWALGGLTLTCDARRRALRAWYSWPSLLRSGSFGLGLGAVLLVGIVWSNVIAPSHESDDEYGAWYLVFYVGLLVYFFVAGLVVAGQPASVARGAWTGALTAVLVALIALGTFVVVDNLFLDVVMTQPDKAAGFARSGMTSQRDFVNQGLLAGMVLVPGVLGVLGAGFGALGGLLRTQLDRRPPDVPAPQAQA